MNATWWLDPGQLDDKQRSILVEPPETEMFIAGPPGCGKTNILLLRANYVRSLCPRLILMTFTRTLAEFLRSGPNVGRADQIQSNEIVTFMGFARHLIKELGGELPQYTGDFDEDRRSTLDEVEQLLDEQKTGKLYDVVFIDEVQSLWKRELDVIRQLSYRINAAGDNRQRIFPNREGIPTVKGLIGKVVELTEHYRIGEAICAFADQILPPPQGEAPLLEGCNYPEDDRPSLVEAIPCASEAAQIDECLERIKSQLRYITDEPIGVLSIRGDLRDRFWDALQADGELCDIAILQKSEAYQPFGPEGLVRVMTVHSAQGSEFRAVHLLGAEEYYPSRRELAFTAVTRAKTELSLYHTQNLSGHMIPPTRELRSLSSIF